MEVKRERKEKEREEEPQHEFEAACQEDREHGRAREEELLSKILQVWGMQSWQKTRTQY